MATHRKPRNPKPARSTSSGQATSTSSGQATSTSSGQATSTSSGQATSTSSGQATSTSSGQATSTSSGPTAQPVAVPADPGLKNSAPIPTRGPQFGEPAPTPDPTKFTDKHGSTSQACKVFDTQRGTLH